MSSFSTMKQAKTRGMEDWNDSQLVKGGYVGRVDEGPETEEESRIKKGIMPQPEELLNILTRQTDSGASTHLADVKGKRNAEVKGGLCGLTKTVWKHGRGDQSVRGSNVDESHGRNRRQGHGGTRCQGKGDRPGAYEGRVGNTAQGRHLEKGGHILQGMLPSPPRIEEEESREVNTLCAHSTGVQPHIAKDMGRE